MRSRCQVTNEYARGVVKRKWFLGKETLATDVSNTNPYITITQLKAAEVALPVPWYRKWYVWLGAGVVGGIVLVR